MYGGRGGNKVESEKRSEKITALADTVFTDKANADEELSYYIECRGGEVYLKVEKDIPYVVVNGKFYQVKEIC